MRDPNSPDLRDYDLLCAANSWQQKHGYPPTIRDLVKCTGWSSTSLVQHHLRHLRTLGCVAFEDGAGRTLRVLRLLTEKPAPPAPKPLTKQQRLDEALALLRDLTEQRELFENGEGGVASVWFEHAEALLR